MGKLEVALIRCVRESICALKGHDLDYRHVREEKIPEFDVTCFAVRCKRCGNYQVFAVKNSALRCTYPIDLCIKKEVDWDGKS